MRLPVSGAPLLDAPATTVAPRPGLSRDRRLVAQIAPVRSLDRSTVDAAFELFESLYLGADRLRFERDLGDKHLIILLRDDIDGVLRGFSTVHVGDVTHRGRPARLVYSGDTVIHPAYWGQKRLQRAFSTILVRERLSHPTRPLLWFLISKGYKTYLLLVHHFPRSFPRVDRPADPDLRATLQRLAHSRFGHAYDPQTGVISFPIAHERVRDQVAPIDRPLMSDPHVAFFASRNPGYERGDELACLAHVRLVDPIRIFVRSWWRARRVRRFK